MIFVAKIVASEMESFLGDSKVLPVCLFGLLGRCISMAAARNVPSKFTGEELIDPLWFMAMHEVESRKLKSYFNELPESERPLQHIL
jgi:hypothetical protein